MFVAASFQKRCAARKFDAYAPTPRQPVASSASGTWHRAGGSARHFNPLAIVPAIVSGKTQNLIAVVVFARKFQKDAERLDVVTREVVDGVLG